MKLEHLESHLEWHHLVVNHLFQKWKPCILFLLFVMYMHEHTYFIYTCIDCEQYKIKMYICNWSYSCCPFE